MATYLGGYGTPGIGAIESTSERAVLFSDPNKWLFADCVYGGAIRDAVNSPTTIIRPGMIVGKVTASGVLEEWDADASDGTQNIAGILCEEIRAQDFNATDADRYYRTLIRGPVKAAQLLIQGTAFTSHTDEHLARRQLVGAGMIFDDDPFGYEAGRGNRMATVTGTTDTLTVEENGTTLFYSNAASVTVTLPTIRAGLEYTLIRTADEEFIVASAAGDDIIAGGDASADSVTWTTAGQQIGAALRVRSFYVSTTLKWIFEVVPTPYSTGAFLASSFAS